MLTSTPAKGRADTAAPDLAASLEHDDGAAVAGEQDGCHQRVVAGADEHHVRGAGRAAAVHRSRQSAQVPTKSTRCSLTAKLHSLAADRAASLKARSSPGEVRRSST